MNRVEKCRKSGYRYYENIVTKFETNMRSAKMIGEILNKFIDTTRKEEIDYNQNREVELARGLSAKRSLMMGRTEIPRWNDQEFYVWKKELEKWNENDKSSDETK